MDDAQTAIYVAIRTSPRRLRVALASKNPIEGDEATRKLADRILGSLEGFEIRKIDRPPAPGHRANCGYPTG